MANLRFLEIKLGQQIEDKVNQKLGYREYSVILPGGLSLEPRPEVVQKTFKQFSEAQLSQFIDKMGGGLPGSLYAIQVSRAISPELVEEGGIWVLQRDDQDFPVECILLQLVYEDSRYNCVVGSLKTSVFGA